MSTNCDTDSVTFVVRKSNQLRIDVIHSVQAIIYQLHSIKKEVAELESHLHRHHHRYPAFTPPPIIDSLTTELLKTTCSAPQKMYQLFVYQQHAHKNFYRLCTSANIASLTYYSDPWARWATAAASKRKARKGVVDIVEANAAPSPSSAPAPAPSFDPLLRLGFV